MRLAAGPGLGEAPAAGAGVQRAGRSQRCLVAAAGHSAGTPHVGQAQGWGGEGSGDPWGCLSQSGLPEASGAGMTLAGCPSTAPWTLSPASPQAAAVVTAPWGPGHGGVTPWALRHGRPGPVRGRGCLGQQRPVRGSCAPCRLRLRLPPCPAAACPIHTGQKRPVPWPLCFS